MQTSLKIDSKQASDGIEGIIHRAQDMTPAMSGISEGMRSSAVRNFEVGGRYERAGSLRGGTTKWAPVKRNPTPLLRTGTLRNSVHEEHTATTAAISSGLKYSAIHNFGGTRYARSELFVRNRKAEGSVPGHPKLRPFLPGTTPGKGQTYGESQHPARPFMVIQDRDIDEYKNSMRAWLLRSATK